MATWEIINNKGETMSLQSSNETQCSVYFDGEFSPYTIKYNSQNGCTAQTIYNVTNELYMNKTSSSYDVSLYCEHFEKGWSQSVIADFETYELCGNNKINVDGRVKQIGGAGPASDYINFDVSQFNNGNTYYIAASIKPENMYKCKEGDIASATFGVFKNSDLDNKKMHSTTFSVNVNVKLNYERGLFYIKNTYTEKPIYIFNENHGTGTFDASDKTCQFDSITYNNYFSKEINCDNYDSETVVNSYNAETKECIHGVPYNKLNDKLYLYTSDDGKHFVFEADIAKPSLI